MFQKALKIEKGRQWSIPNKKGRQRRYSPDKCNIIKIGSNLHGCFPKGTQAYLQSLLEYRSINAASSWNRANSTRE